MRDTTPLVVPCQARPDTGTHANPYRIEGPAQVCFSGGRTSGYMLAQILAAHEGKLPADVRVIFTNTGKERRETLEFVDECSRRWEVPITWLERTAGGGVREADLATADCTGAPFAQLITEKSYLPNPIMRFCTQELKIRVAKRYLRETLGWEYWDNVLGLRADEPRRVAKALAPNRDRWDNCCPLAQAGTTLAEVMEFWKGQPFDLRLRQNEGNCDLCFLKRTSKVLALLEEYPERGAWWAEQERRVGATFRKDRPRYAALLAMVEAQARFCFSDEDLEGCGCTD